MARGKTASAPARTKAKSSAKASTRRIASTPRTQTQSTVGGLTYRELYAEAQRRDIKGRSSMDKAQLERVLNAKRAR